MAGSVAQEWLAAALGASSGDEGALEVHLEDARWSITVEFSRSAPGGALSEIQVHLATTLPERTGPAVAGAYRDRPRRECQLRPRLLVRRPNRWDHLGRRLGMVSAPGQGGGFALDGREYVESDAPVEAVRAVLDDDRTRTALTALLDLGCEQVALHDTEDVLEARVWMRVTVDSEPGRLREVLARLGELARSLPDFRGRRTSRSRLWSYASSALAGLWLAMPLLGVVTSGVAIDMWPLVDRMRYAELVGLGLAAAAVAMVLAFRLARRSTRGLRWFLAAAGAALIGLPAVALGSALLVNALFDTAAPSEHEVLVVAKAQRKYRFVTVQDWRGPAEVREVQVGWEPWNEMEPGAPVRIAVGAGRLGWPYWVGVELPDGRSAGR